MRYTITSALPYANGPLHIGHIAGAYLPADIFARYLRLKGHDVAFICGSDEHGAAITLQAKKEGTSPKQIIDRNHKIIKKTFSEFGISFDIYHRTSEALHHQTAQDFFLKLYNSGKFTEKISEQYFDMKENMFLADRYIKGTCPNCGYEDAYGDQCEQCGTSLSPKELIDAKSTISGSKPTLKETSHWYLPMNNYEGWLKQWIVKEKKDKWKSNVYGQCKSWIDQGLRERSMTRDLDWGVAVPLPSAEEKVLYVWLDAPIGYISATKQWCINNNKNWKDYWQSPETKLIHFIGKDNIVFHCIIFPILLKAHGDFILPDNVPANEFLNLEGDKISTSRNWAVWIHEYLAELPGKEDVLRYVLNSIAPETKDSEFTWSDYQSKNNNELVAIYGNLVNRLFVLGHKYFNGDFVSGAPILYQYDINKIRVKLSKTKEEIERLIESYHFREAQSVLMDLARLGNKILTEEEPWKSYKEDPEKARNVLEVIIQIIANISILSEPFMPLISKELRNMIGMPTDCNWEQSGKLEILKKGHKINETRMLFEKIEDETIENQTRKLKLANNKNNKYMPVKDEVKFDDFQKMDIRIGEIINAKKVDGADKLLQFEVDLGFEKRTIVSGIAEQFDPLGLIGQKVCVLANLAPRKIRGVESQGMILLAEDTNGKLQFIEADSSEPGSSVN